MTFVPLAARAGAIALTLVVSAAALEARAPSAKDRFDAARTLDVATRAAVERVPPSAASSEIDRVVRPARRVLLAYEGVVRRFPTSGYSDNALLQAGQLSQWLYSRFGRPADRTAANRYFDWLVREYPSSSLRAAARAAVRDLDVRTVVAQQPARAPRAPAPRSAAAAPATSLPASPTVPARREPAAPTIAGAGPLPAAAAIPATGAVPLRATLRSIDRVVLDGTVRVTLALDREAPFSHEVIDGPARAFVDLFGAAVAEPLQDASFRYDSDAVRAVRVGRRPGAVRVVLDLEGATRVSVFTLYNPYRVVIDADRSADARALTAAVTRAVVATPVVLATDESRLPDEPPPAGASAAVPAGVESTRPAVPPAGPAAVAAAASSPSTSIRPAPVLPDERPVPVFTPPPPTVTPAMPAPGEPSANADGSFSLARQLGLGISRIVIDPGHGGHDPGTPTTGSSEARLVLDVALRLEKLLVKDGFDVVLTRRTDVFIPLEERTAIANREGADLFLSIHANSGRDPRARGVEVYYLSFASNPEAEAVAARENATSASAMHSLPSIVRAIALNNKLDESRDFAQMVQHALTSRLSKTNEGMRSRGVKKAPFVVLIGAAMPSVLAEIGFITNKQEVGLIKTPAYRQRIAESLQAAVSQYQRALKRQTAVATR